MKSGFRKMVHTSIRRRHKEVGRVSLIAFLAAFFVMLTILFQDNMDLYQHRADQIKYGEWFLSETMQKDEETSDVLAKHPYLDRCGVMYKGAMMMGTSYYMGYADDVIMDMGHIRLQEGRMPENSTEIVMELNVLANLGLGSDLNQQIELKCMGSGGKSETQTFTLTGILVNYTLNWANGGDLPAALVTKEAYDNMGVTNNTIYMYHLQDGTRVEEESQFINGLSKMINEPLIYNGNAAKVTVWGSNTTYLQIVFLLVVISVCAITYTYFTYVMNRKKEYFRMRSFGVSRVRLKGMIIYEGLYSCVPAMLIGFAAAMVGNLLVCVLLMCTYQTEFLFYLKAASILICVLSMVVTDLISILLVTLVVNDRRIYENIRTIPVKKLKRIRIHGKLKINRRNVYAQFSKRERKLFPLRLILTSLLSLAVMAAVLMCISKIYHYYNHYQREKKLFYDFTSYIPPENTSYEYTSANSDRKCHIGQQEYRYDAKLDDSMIRELQFIDGMDMLECMTQDSSTTIRWEGIENSNIRALQIGKLGQQKPLVIEEIMYSYGTTFYKDAKMIYESYRDYIDPAYYDVDAFIRGEQVLYRSNNVRNKIQDNGLQITEGEKENTLHIGDTVHYETAAGDVNATVVGFIYDADNVVTNTGSYSYEFVGSEQFGRKLAASDDRDYGYNLIRVNLKNNLNFKDANNQITNLFNRYGVDYGTKYEKKRQWRDEFIQKAFIFSIVIAIIVAVYIVIYANIISTRMAYRSRNLRLLKGLGATDGRLARMEIMRCLLENVVIFLAIPIVTGFHYYTLYNSYVHPTKGVWGGFYDETLKQWSGNAVKGAWQTTFQSEVNAAASVAAVVIVFLVLFIVAIQPVIGRLKKINQRMSAGK